MSTGPRSSLEAWDPSAPAGTDGASLEKRSAHEEAARLRRRTEEAEQRLEAAIAEMHQARMEATEYTANRSKLTEVEAQDPDYRAPWGMDDEEAATADAATAEA